MSLRDKLDSKLAGAWIKLDDVPVDATVEHRLTVTYDPTSGVTESFDTYPVQIVLDEIKEEDRAVNQPAIDNFGGLGQYKALIRLAEIDIVPAVNDKVVMLEEEYQITVCNTDPARVLWTGFLKKRGEINSGLAG